MVIIFDDAAMSLEYFGTSVLLITLHNMPNMPRMAVVGILC